MQSVLLEGKPFFASYFNVLLSVDISTVALLIHKLLAEIHVHQAFINLQQPGDTCLSPAVKTLLSDC